MFVGLLEASSHVNSAGRTIERCNRETKVLRRAGAVLRASLMDTDAMKVIDELRNRRPIENLQKIEKQGTVRVRVHTGR